MTRLYISEILEKMDELTSNVVGEWTDDHIKQLCDIVGGNTGIEIDKWDEDDKDKLTEHYECMEYFKDVDGATPCGKIDALLNERDEALDKIEELKDERKELGERE